MKACGSTQPWDAFIMKVASAHGQNMHFAAFAASQGNTWNGRPQWCRNKRRSERSSKRRTRTVNLGDVVHRDGYKKEDAQKVLLTGLWERMCNDNFHFVLNTYLGKGRRERNSCFITSKPLLVPSHESRRHMPPSRRSSLPILSGNICAKFLCVVPTIWLP